jgi:hypothetical protein
MTDDQSRDPLAKEAAEGGLPTMSTDTTPQGRMLAGEGDDLIARVHDGMRVIDASGEDIGKVRLVRMGDPEAASVRGQEMSTGANWLADLGEVLVGGDDVPETLRHRLVRVGFIQIDATGWFNSDLAAGAFQIAGVETDTVLLNVNKDQLVKV